MYDKINKLIDSANLYLEFVKRVDSRHEHLTTTLIYTAVKNLAEAKDLYLSANSDGALTAKQSDEIESKFESVRSTLRKILESRYGSYVETDNKNIE